MPMKSITILTTGGTIEKSYSELDGSLKNRSSGLKKRMLSRLRLPHTEVHLVEVMAKDSLDMTEEDRRQIFNRFQEELKKAENPVLILHGTDTMEQTATYFFRQLPEPPVPVIFTGAMRPVGFEDSDAMQNFVEAMIACHLVTPGIYISFHSHIFPLPGVRKNKKRRTFEKV